MDCIHLRARGPGSAYIYRVHPDGSGLQKLIAPRAELGDNALRVSLVHPTGARMYRFYRVG
jgi:hypothetical protein